MVFGTGIRLGDVDELVSTEGLPSILFHDILLKLLSFISPSIIFISVIALGPIFDDVIAPFFIFADVITPSTIFADVMASFSIFCELTALSSMLSELASFINPCDSISVSIIGDFQSPVDVKYRVLYSATSVSVTAGTKPALLPSNILSV